MRKKELQKHSIKIIKKFLNDVPPENIYKYSFEFIPLFWVLPLFFFDENLSAKFVPHLLIKHKDESHLLLDINKYFGYPEKILKRYLNLNNQDLLLKIKKRYQLGIKKVDKFYKKISENNRYSEKELNFLLEENLKIFQKFFTSTTPAYLDDKSVFDLAKSNPEINEDKIKKILKIDIHRSFEFINEEALLKFIKSNNKNYESIAYIFTTYSKVPTKKEIKKFLETTNKNSLAKSVKNKYNKLKLNFKKYKNLYQRLNPKEKRLVDFIELIKTIREDRKQYFSKIFYCLYKISGLLLKKWKLKGIRNGFVFAFELLKGKKYIEKIKDEIKKRRLGYVVYYDKDDRPTLKPFSGDTSYALQYLKNQFSKATTIIKGNIAYKGKVKGKVVIAIKNKDFQKIKENEILVTSMTRPEIVPYLKKVKAIITDEGGITCHAAIISRELKIPCIIGTKIATQVLKDGDLVEIDAEKGMVKILKKQNKKFYNKK